MRFVHQENQLCFDLQGSELRVSYQNWVDVRPIYNLLYAFSRMDYMSDRQTSYTFNLEGNTALIRGNLASALNKLKKHNYISESFYQQIVTHVRAPNPSSFFDKIKSTFPRKPIGYSPLPRGYDDEDL